MSPLEYFGIMLIGLLGTGHCVGMCGGFALMAGEGAKNPTALLYRHTLYQLGKASTYMFLALLLFLLGAAFQGASWFSSLQYVLAWVAGIIMVLFGWTQLSGRSLTRGIKMPSWLSGGKGCSLMLALFSKRSGGSVFLLGWMNGFIPCGLSYGVILYLATLQSLEASLGGAFVFGMATMPGLYLLARSRLFFNLDRRVWLIRAMGVTVVLFGVMSMIRGTPGLQEWVGENVYARFNVETPAVLAGFLPDLSGFGCCGTAPGQTLDSSLDAAGEASCCAAQPSDEAASDQSAKASKEKENSCCEDLSSTEASPQPLSQNE
ncbi:MAG: sulfite exporter TauE/SafE family protein [Opitutales bacterium]|nr:sulfite exporter TauE/SafE family protein [Opitutales bacterium]MCH8540242.1 sulfite exporter TauE/SafE family protein [Opitutales bacterium]